MSAAALPKTYVQHPLSAAFPAMSAEDFQALTDSIDNIGVQNPITLFEGMVGRHGGGGRKESCSGRVFFLKRRPAPAAAALIGHRLAFRHQRPASLQRRIQAKNGAGRFVRAVAMRRGASANTRSCAGWCAALRASRCQSAGGEVGKLGGFVSCPWSW